MMQIHYKSEIVIKTLSSQYQSVQRIVEETSIPTLTDCIVIPAKIVYTWTDNYSRILHCSLLIKLFSMPYIYFIRLRSEWSVGQWNNYELSQVNCSNETCYSSNSFMKNQFTGRYQSHWSGIIRIQSLSLISCEITIVHVLIIPKFDR